MSSLLRRLYDACTWPIRERWIGSLQAAAVVRSHYVTSTLRQYIQHDREYDILDAGSGQGAPLSLVLARRYSNCRFVAIDLYQQNPSEQHLGLPSNITLIKNDLFKYSANNDYDIIICLDVLEHIDNYEKALNIFNKWLKPGGKLLVHVPSMHKFKYFTSNDKQNALNGTQRLGDYHVRDGYSLENITNDIEKAGFRIISVQYTFSSTTWFFKELFSIGEKISFPGIGILILPFILLSTKIEIILKPTKGNGIFVVAKKL
jgi:2-polyprenyl-3-methyl-5-hydroxy-6-metoxy-1,4-benzoquinol methylase